MNANVSFVRLISYLLALILLFFSIILMVFYPEKFNPDFDSYLQIYGLSIRDAPSQTSNTMRYIFSYFQFLPSYKIIRSLLAISQLVLYFYIFKKLRFKFSDIGLITFTPLISIILLKGHVQIRESIALILFFLSCLEIEKKNFFSIKNFFLASLSLILHQSMIINYLSCIILLNKKISNSIKIFFLFIIFSSLALSTYPAFVNIVNKVIYLYPTSYDLIQLNIYKSIYWLSWLILIIFAFIRQKNSINLFKNLNTSKTKVIEILGIIGTYGFLFYFPISLLGLSLGQTNGAVFNYIIRLTLNLNIFISLYQIKYHKKSIYTAGINFVTLFSIGRLLFFPSLLLR